MLDRLATDVELALTWKTLAIEPVHQLAEMLSFLVDVALGFDNERWATEDRIARLSGKAARAAQQLAQDLRNLEQVARVGGLPVLDAWPNCAHMLDALGQVTTEYPDGPSTPKRKTRKQAIIAFLNSSIAVHREVREKTPAYRRQAELPVLTNTDAGRLLTTLFVGETFSRKDIGNAQPVSDGRS